MKVTRFESELRRLPLERPADVPGRAGHKQGEVSFLLVQLEADGGHRGVGVATIPFAGEALRMLVESELKPLVLGANPLERELLDQRVRETFGTAADDALFARAWSAVDVAFWDLTGRAANLPVASLLGGARPATSAFVGDIGWLWMTPEQTIDAAPPLLQRGAMGIQVHVGCGSPEADADRLTRIRESLGEDAWLGVNAGGRYDYATALSMGHFFEEEMGVDWFEDPIPADDIDGHARLAEKLEVPIAVGSAFGSLADFCRVLESGAADVLRPDVGRVGGLTRLVKVAHLAEAFHKPVAVRGPAGICVHAACGLAGARTLELDGSLAKLFGTPPDLSRGCVSPPAGPGLGLQVRAKTAS